jgi:cytochrome c nitrite reductase small subunit
MSRIALIAGISAFLVAIMTLLVVTDAPAYMGSDPNTCNNCHVMDAAYENWYHAGHHGGDLECVDCHLPHDNLVAYYIEKGRSGMHDVYVFSTGQTPEMIRASEHTKEIIQSNCIRCHQSRVQNMLAGLPEFDRHCWDCHRAVAHGERGISIVPRQEP